MAAARCFQRAAAHPAGDGADVHQACSLRSQAASVRTEISCTTKVG